MQNAQYYNLTVKKFLGKYISVKEKYIMVPLYLFSMLCDFSSYKLGSFPMKSHINEDT